MDTNGKRRTNKRWPELLKREIVAASFAPGASVSVVARQYDVNVNQVFAWRRRFGAPLAAVAPTSPVSRPRLVAVSVASDDSASSPASSASSNGSAHIEIEVGGTYRVRIDANFDERVLRRLLDVLVIR